MTDHGTPGGYWRHITEDTEPCQPCRDAGTASKARWRRRSYLNHGPLLVDSTGTRRRIRALAAMGWPLAELGRIVGVSYHTVWSWTDSARVRADTAETVRQLYDKLAMTPGPSRRARTIAKNKGWLPPLCWDDDTIDDPAAKPYKALRTTGTPASRDPEIVAEIARLTGFGLSAERIGERVGMSARNVVRIRSLTARNGEREAS